ncbi:MAG: hypothetical protein IPM63_17270 [Acidobacteriota bacterium]|nr:MAG: hypothetical protein IPM63_17270 [Acidobacteriota bacterium]
MKRSGLKAFALAVLLGAAIASAAAPSAFAKSNEFDKVCDHLEERYEAKKVKIPFQWLARAAVGIVKPAGVKSFKVTVYRDLKFTRESLDSEMRWVMSDAFDSNWSPILRVISRNGEQVYMNAREYKDNVKVLLVTINRDEAVVVRAKFDADKLAEFIENPKIFGIELDGQESS